MTCARCGHEVTAAVWLGDDGPFCSHDNHPSCAQVERWIRDARPAIEAGVLTVVENRP